MSDLPKAVQINEEGPREGFQIEPGPIATSAKIALIDALSRTGLTSIQVASFVNPKRVPGWADADAVVEGFEPRPGVKYTALWLNEKGLERALSHRDRLHVSEVFQKAFVKADEKGTEAAAATAASYVRFGRPPAAQAEFKADHPFLFFIRDNATGLIVFMGRVADPSAK